MLDDFFIPENGLANEIIKLQQSIYGSDKFTQLFPYLKNVVPYLTRKKKGQNGKPIIKNKNYQHKLLSTYSKLIHSFSKYKGVQDVDLLVVGTTSRKPEIAMMISIVTGLVKHHISIGYIGNDVEVLQLREWLKEKKLSNVLFFNDLQDREDFLGRHILNYFANIIAEIDLSDFLPYLDSTNLILQGDYFNYFFKIAKTKIQWELLKRKIGFQHVLLRQQASPLSSCIAFNAAQSGIPCVSMQHGLIALPFSPNLPIITDKYICYGNMSQKVLKHMDFLQAKNANRDVFCRQYIPCGSLVDEIHCFQNAFDFQTLLVLDQECDWVAPIYGIEMEFEVLEKIIKEVLQKKKIVQRVIIRPHPGNKYPKRWLKLAEEFPNRVEISHPAHSLSFDLSRSTLSIGLFSTSQIVSLVSGVPSLFLWEPGWFYTPDLRCFYENFFIPPYSAPDFIASILSDPQLYDHIRNLGIVDAQKYYKDGKQCDFEENIFEYIFQA